MIISIITIMLLLLIIIIIITRRAASLRSADALALKHQAADKVP